VPCRKPGSHGRRSQLPSLLCSRVLLRCRSPCALLAFSKVIVVLLPQEAGVRREDMAARSSTYVTSQAQEFKDIVQFARSKGVEI
jgi:hypothetical protein